MFAGAGGALLEDLGLLDAVVALCGGVMSAAHLDRDPETVRHAASAARRLLEPDTVAGSGGRS